MSINPTIATVVFPSRDLNAGIAAWTTVFGTGPMFAGDDFAAFKTDEIEIGVSSLPWVDEPLVMLAVDDIDEARRELLDAGATAMAEVEGGGLAVLGTEPVTNGDPETGIVDTPGARLAVVRLSNGNFLALRQPVAMEW